MAKSSGLGRGLGSLISGGAPAVKQVAAKKAPAVKSAGGRSVAKKTKVPKVAKKEAKSAVVKAAPQAPETPAAGLQEVPTGKIIPNPHQPRRTFDADSLAELRESIRSEGLLQPVVARRKEDGTFELIAGERRLRACKELKMKTVPVRIIEVSEASSAVLSMIENLQREDLNPIEEAMGYVSLMKDFNLKQDQVAERVGRSRASVANATRLLNLPREVQNYLTKGHLSVGHAKVLLGVPGPESQIQLARRTIEEGWSVRELENHLQAVEKKPDSKSRKGGAHGAEEVALQDLQKRLASTFSTPVQLKHTPRKGKIIIEYFGNDDLQRILEQMGVREA
jgi:ParB family chromosome partitioning protein